MREKIYSFLGFAARARKLVWGKERLRDYIKAPKKVKLVVIAEDASERTKYDIKLRCKNTGTEFLVIFTKKELGKLLGKDEISAVGVEDENIIKGVLESNVGG